LGKYFKRIIYYPYHVRGSLIDLPEGVSVDVSFSRLRLRRILNPANWAAMAWNQDFRNEWANQKADAGRVVMGGLTIGAVARWVRRRSKNFCQSGLFYTCSLSPITLGLYRGLVAQRGQRVISRCTGGDVREDQHDTNYIPYKNASLSEIDHIFPVSKNLNEFLTGQNPQLKNKSTVSRNGVPPAGFVARISDDGVRRIVSCGRMVSLKRYNLLARALVQLAARKPGVRFCWKHMLPGEMDESVRRLLDEKAPPNLSTEFVVGVRNVVSYYKELKIDLFVHVSRSEGFGVAVAEALSCGIPVFATNSGGVSDMVDDSVGRLADNDLDSGSLATELWALLEEPALLAGKKKAALERWRTVANAEVNYDAFARILAEWQGA
jgi:glycosyltransferase involved in cell wall biosynthesis